MEANAIFAVVLFGGWFLYWLIGKISEWTCRIEAPAIKRDEVHVIDYLGKTANVHIFRVKASNHRAIFYHGTGSDVHIQREKQAGEYLVNLKGSDEAQIDQERVESFLNSNRR